jgi:microcin C transport system substrate-binding protein
MRLLLTLASFAILAACSREEPPPADSAAEPAAEVVTQTDTHLVATLPTYESVPLPDGLEWVTNEEDPVYASPEAQRGGTFRGFLQGFPLTLRMYGPDANSDDFVLYKRANFLSLLDIHPNTLNFVPSLATHWAFGADGKTVYYKLNPNARWSDGTPIVADDYLFFRDFQLSPFTVEPFGANTFTNIIVAVRKHDDYTISVEGASAKPKNELLYEYSLPPMARHFHKLDEKWVQDYDWRIEPNTGPYQIAALEKGRYIELKRVQNWWGDELKYNKNRFNVDTIRLDVIRDQDVAYEYFLRGDLDRYLFEISPARWHEKARGEIFDRGYAGRIQFYNDIPRRARGLWLNLDDPLLADKNLRLGLAYALNMDRVLATVFRNDYERLNQAYQGYYWGYSDDAIKALPFDLAKANQYFDASGWTQRGPDGIRMKDGQRLAVSISYGTDDHSPWLIVVREEAKKAGIELNLQLLDPAAWGRQIQEKKHQIVVLTLGAGLTPSYWQASHSENAHKPNTNNLTNTDDPEIDRLIDEYEVATDLETRVDLSHRIQHLLADQVAFIPLFNIPYIRETYWRWLKLPESHSVRIADDSLGIFDPVGLGLFWIDEQAKAETLEAQASGRTFPPVDIVDTTWRTR